MGAAPAVYVAPNPPLVVFGGAITATQVAQQATVGNKSPALIAVRDGKMGVLVPMVHSQLAYVNQLASASPANAAQIITGAGFALPAARSATKLPLELELVPGIPGTVRVMVNKALLAGPRNRKAITLHYSYSLDGKTWTLAKSTSYATVDIPNLPLMTTVFVRVSADVGKDIGAPIDAQSIVVH